MPTTNDEIVDTPGKMTGKLFEQRLLDHVDKLERRKILTMGRYGVQASMIGGKTMAVQSLPDFEGTTNNGAQFICEAKCIDTDTLSVNGSFLKKRQVTHLVRRADFNVPCFLIVHHYGRELKTKTVPNRTMVYPVHRKLEWVSRCLAAYAKGEEPKGSIPADMGFEIEWLLTPRAKNPGPDIVTAIKRTQHVIISLNTP